MYSNKKERNNHEPKNYSERKQNLFHRIFHGNETFSNYGHNSWSSQDHHRQDRNDWHKKMQERLLREELNKELDDRFNKRHPF